MCAPAEAIDHIEIEGNHQLHHLKAGWKPEGWDEWVAIAAAQGDRWALERPDFFWPSQTKTYKSRSSARDKQAIVRRWGGDAEILVAEVGDFKPIAEVTASRARARRQVRIDKLQAQITALEAQTETCPSRAAAASPWAERTNET